MLKGFDLSASEAIRFSAELRAPARKAIRPFLFASGLIGRSGHLVSGCRVCSCERLSKKLAERLMVGRNCGCAPLLPSPSHLSIRIAPCRDAKSIIEGFGRLFAQSVELLDGKHLTSWRSRLSTDRLRQGLCNFSST